MLQYCHCKNSRLRRFKEDLPLLPHLSPLLLLLLQSDNWAIWGAVAAARRRRPGGPLPHVVTSSIEHPAVLEALEAWRQLVRALRQGRENQLLGRSCAPGTCLCRAAPSLGF